MPKYTCKNVEYIFAHQCEVDGSGNVVPKSGETYKELNSRNKVEFSENAKNKDGNIFYEQSLKMLIYFNDINIVKELSNSHLILRLTDLNGNVFIWGALMPYNIVQVNIDTIDNTAELDFFRDATQPEYS
ncbi:MAG: hypothetical protein J7K53_11345 [Bacteroidales bacterium]|nr:hypothetical protein [Bacteroidales bacterium]